MGAHARVTTAYGLTGVLTALWGATLPATDARLDLGAARLGGVLMALAAGALVAMPGAGWLAERWTGERVLRVALPAAAAGLTGPALAPSFGDLMVAAVVLGVCFGGLNVALSIEAVAVERELNRPVIATMHGVWTLGAVAGGGVTSAALRHGLDVQALMSVGAVALVLAGLAPGRRSVDQGSVWPGSVDRVAARGPADPMVPLRPGVVLTLGLLGAAAFLTEGAATDWAGVHATRVLGADPATASLVYTVFSAAMTVVRLAGDAVRARLGAPMTMRLAGTIASVGYGLVLLAGVLPTGLSTRVGCVVAGWALAGAGTATMWPIISSALGAAVGGAGRRLSLVTTISYGGGLAGPALIGSVAACVSLPVALLIPAAVAVLVAVVAPRSIVRQQFSPTTKAGPRPVTPRRAL